MAANHWTVIAASNTTHTSKKDGMADIGKRLLQLRALRVGEDRPQRTALSPAQTLGFMAKARCIRRTRSGKGTGMRALSPPMHWAPWRRLARPTPGSAWKRLSAWVSSSCPDWLSAAFLQTTACKARCTLNVHIRRVSDVDLLILDTCLWTYDSAHPSGGGALRQQLRRTAQVDPLVQAGQGRHGKGRQDGLVSELRSRRHHVSRRHGPAPNRLGVRAGQRFVDYLHYNKDFARTLVAPDGLRRIYDDPSKLDGLTQLPVEVDDLLKQVTREHGYGVSTYHSMDDLRTKLKLTSIET